MGIRIWGRGGWGYGKRPPQKTAQQLFAFILFLTGRGEKPVGSFLAASGQLVLVGGGSLRETRRTRSEVKPQRTVTDKINQFSSAIPRNREEKKIIGRKDYLTEPRQEERGARFLTRVLLFTF